MICIYPLYRQDNIDNVYNCMLDRYDGGGFLSVENAAAAASASTGGRSTVAHPALTMHAWMKVRLCPVGWNLYCGHDPPYTHMPLYGSPVAMGHRPAL